MISNVALLGRPLLVKIIFFVRSGIVLFYSCFAIYGCISRRRLEWLFLSRAGFFHYT